MRAFGGVTGACKCANPRRRLLQGTTGMAEHKHGEMDIKVQEDTFASFANFITRATIAILVVLVLMAIFWI